MNCKNIKFPFNAIDNNDLINFTYNSNLNCLCTQKISNINTNKFQFLLNLHNETQSSSSHDPDIAKQFEQYVDLKPNFDYHDIHSFHKLKNKLPTNLKNTILVFFTQTFAPLMLILKNLRFSCMI